MKWSSPIFVHIQHYELNTKGQFFSFFATDAPVPMTATPATTS
jgi:hypothetical protein